MAHNINGRAKPKDSVGFAPLEGYGMEAKGNGEGYHSMQRTNKDESFYVGICKYRYIKNISF